MCLSVRRVLLVIDGYFSTNKTHLAFSTVRKEANKAVGKVIIKSCMVMIYAIRLGSLWEELFLHTQISNVIHSEDDIVISYSADSFPWHYFFPFLLHDFLSSSILILLPFFMLVHTREGKSLGSCTPSCLDALENFIISFYTTFSQT